MADKTLLFKTDAGNEVNSVQVLKPRLEQAVALGGSTVTEEHDRVLARDKDGNIVVNPVLTDILNSEFINVIRRGVDGNLKDDFWVTFATTSNAENGGVDPEHSLLVSLKDLELSILVPNDVSTVTTEPTSEPNPDYDDSDPESPENLAIEALCKYYGKPIKLDAPEEQAALWALVADRTVRLHKNNGTSVSGKWALDLERIEKETPDVLHLHVTADDELLAIDLDPAKVQIIPVTFTPDDGQDVFKLILFIRPFDLRNAQKQLKLSNSTSTPAEAQFLRPWVIVEPTKLDNTILTGAIGEGGLLKVVENEDITTCVKAVDAADGSAVTVTVDVIPTHAGFNTTGALDSVKLPSVPAEFDETSELKNLVENGEFTVKAVVSAEGYESQEIELAVCINAEDERPGHLTIVLDHEALSLKRTLVNGTADTNEVSCTTRHNESDAVVDSSLTVTGISGKDGNTEKSVTATVVNDLGAASKTIYVKQGKNGEPTGYILVKCVCSGYVTEVIKLPVELTDKRLPDDDAKWTINWTTKPSVTIDENAEGKNGEALEAVVSSQGLEGALVGTTGTINGNIKNQWGEEEEVDAVVIGVVDAKHPLTNDTADVVSIPENAGDTTDDNGTPDNNADDTPVEGAGCWIHLSILTKSGLLIVKKVQASVTDEREA